MLLSILGVSASILLFAEAVNSFRSLVISLLPETTMSANELRSTLALSHRDLDRDEDTRVVAIAGR